MKQRILPLLLLLSSCILSAETLTDTQGRSIQVDILKVGNDSVSVRRADGVEFDIPLSRLDSASQELVRAQPTNSESSKEAFDYAQLNDLLGIELWSDANLWDDAPQEVAYRLNWPQESKTKSQSSFRVYFKKRSPIAGAIPYTAVLYGQNGKVDYISIMFANKGDSVTLDLIDNERKALKVVNEAIESDSEQIENSLAALGKPKRQSSKGGKAMKERALRWDAGNNSILLAAVEDEYLALRIMPPELADQRGRPEKINNTGAKKAAAANVQESDFGDVTIDNIPMVDQGPKGYCVPATLERCLRYMGIRADMYALAMAGSTEIGGGTYISSIIEGTADYVRSSGRQFQQISGDVSVDSVSKYIDNGQPVLWAMYSTHEYNLIVNAITKARMKATDRKEWEKSRAALLKKSPKLKTDAESGHVCLIVGYNEDTGELAVSDSWGPEYELRWITEDEAQDISQGGIFVIDF